jgi:hypothetical protein
MDGRTTPWDWCSYAFASSTHVVSMQLVQDLLIFIFNSDTLDDIKTGLQPFIVADSSAEHRQANLEVSQLYGLLKSGKHALMLADLEALKSKEVQSNPLTYFKLEHNLGMFGNLLGTVLSSLMSLLPLLVPFGCYSLRVSI